MVVSSVVLASELEVLTVNAMHLVLHCFVVDGVQELLAECSALSLPLCQACKVQARLLKHHRHEAPKLPTR